VHMRILIIILIFLSFLQTTIIPLNLVLIVLISRSFIKVERENLYLAFCFGLFLSFLSLNPIGVLSILYLIIIQAIYLISKTRFANLILMILPVSFLMYLIIYTIRFVLQGQTFYFSFNILAETMLTLPTYLVLRYWEERFVVKKEIKLRFRA
jgi:cell shape-determining protein MreD